MGAAAGVGLGLQGASMVMDIYAQKKQAAALNRQQQLALYVARQQAADTISTGKNAAARRLGEGTREGSAQRASTAGRGFEIGTGTSQVIQQATDLISSADAIAIRENSRKQAKNIILGALDVNGPANAKAGIAGTLIGGASSIAAQFANRSNRNKAAASNNQGYTDFGFGE